MQEYAKPISPKINKAIEEGKINLENEEDLNSFIEEIQDIHGDYLYCYGLNQALQNKVYPKAWFEGRVDVQFEGIQVKTHTGPTNTYRNNLETI